MNKCPHPATRSWIAGAQFSARVTEAQSFLSAYFAPTPLIAARRISAATGCDVYLKLESSLPTGSFKPRGALFAIYSQLKEKPIREVVTASTGNHGAAVAYAARQFGLSATIFLPFNSNRQKRSKIVKFGAAIREAGKDLAEAAVAAAAYAATEDAYLLDDASDPAVPIAAATIACEIFDQLPTVQKIYVPVGDSALIRGIASVEKRRPLPPQLIGVQAERAPSYYDSWKAAAVRPSDLCDTIADGLATRRPLASNVAAMCKLVDDFVLVSEEALINSFGTRRKSLASQQAQHPQQRC
ncbi:MAG TPA: pyridoxal-phosphate dependent enzyme [Candidatus Baltobacteraceae bacterium]|jgi:threonine dehydratase|nr:pyridoxal-phosphate dependent enzyme [Candidatus Baltobacteraceae bacterium]